MKELKEITLEICCGSVDDALSAESGGADRVELNSALELGGLTPSIGSVLQTKERLSIPVICMVRPRSGGFCYTDVEFSVMLEDLEKICLAGVDGVAFGILDECGDIDGYRNFILIEKIKSIEQLQGRKIEKVFHRAIDVVSDIDSAMDEIISLGFDRVLTSGQANKAIEANGIQTIARLIHNFGKKIEILPGSGIRPDNVKDFVQKTGVSQIHMSAGEYKIDPSMNQNVFRAEGINEQAVKFNATGPFPEDRYKVVDPGRIVEVKNNLQGIPHC